MEQEEQEKHVERIYKSLKKLEPSEARAILDATKKRFPTRTIVSKATIIDAFPTDGMAFAYADLGQKLGVASTRVKSVALEAGATEITRGVAQFPAGTVPQLPDYGDEEEAAEEDGSEEETEEEDDETDAAE